MNEHDNSNALVNAHWLADHLHDPNIRVIDCTTHMVAQPVGPSKITSGRPDHDKCHIPSAQHIDMTLDLSDPRGEFPYTAIDKPRFAALMDRLQIQPSDHVVLYGQSSISTITRAWFIFYLHGQQVSILDGGLAQWQVGRYEAAQHSTGEQGKPLTTTAPTTVLPTAAHQTRDLIVDRADVQKALQTESRQLINALSVAQFAGTGGAHYGRPGRIPNSLSLPAKEMVDPDTGCFWDLDTLRHKVDQAGIVPTARSIHYCGGGIAATTSAFVLHLLGAMDWAIYDNSLLDWSNQPGCPMICEQST